METVIVIRTANWEFIGVAKDIKSALKLLLENRWIKADTTFYDHDTIKEITLEQLKNRFEMETYLDTLLFLWEDDPDWWFETLYDIFEEDIYDWRLN